MTVDQVTGREPNPQHELAAFLRARRENLQPADVGLRDVGRRRTPGLRREEVATLAGVSIDYLVRLEQGRDLHPSPAIIQALSTALQLNRDEQMHLAKLAMISNHGEFCPARTALVDEVAPTVRFLLDRLDPTPAFVVGPATDVLAANGAWLRLVGPLGLADEATPNLARFVFGHRSARDVYPDWARAADEQVSQLRIGSPRWGHDERFAALVDDLTAFPEFASRWADHTVSAKRRGVKRIVHPHAGELRLAFEVLDLPDDGEQRLITWLAADDTTADRLRVALEDTGAAGQPRLRVVRQA